MKNVLKPHTKRRFLGDSLAKKDRINLGALKIEKTFQRLALLDQADVKLLLSTPAVHYRSLEGTT